MRFSIITPIVLCAYLTHSQAAAVLEKAAGGQAACSNAQSVLTRVGGSSAISSACVSLFGSPKPLSSTPTITATSTVTVAPETVTSTITKTKNTKIKQTLTEFNFTTIVVDGGESTYTDYNFTAQYETSTVKYPNAAHEIHARATSDTPISGVAKTAIYTACSCLFPSPTARTVTSTVAITLTKGPTPTSKTTTTTTVTEYKNSYTTVHDTVTDTTYTYLFTTLLTTIIYTKTTCSGTNPTPSFGLQVVDSPTKTDEFNSLYATQTPYAALKELGTRSFDFTADKQSAAQYNIDCVGRLVTKAESVEGGLEDFYFGLSYFSPHWDVIVSWNQTIMLRQQYYFVKGEPADGDYLRLYALQEGVATLDMLQTVPGYRSGEFGGQLPFVVLGDYVPENGPDATPFRFKKVALP